MDPKSLTFLEHLVLVSGGLVVNGTGMNPDKDQVGIVGRSVVVEWVALIMARCWIARKMRPPWT